MVSTAQPNRPYMAPQPQHISYASNEFYPQHPMYQRNPFFPRNYNLKIPRQPVYNYPKYYKKYTPANTYNRTRKMYKDFSYQNTYNNFAAPPPTASNMVAVEDEATGDTKTDEEDPENQTGASATENDDSEASFNANKKTAMTLLNELARYNKMEPQYILQDEIGPAHKKTFYVTLKLDEKEEYMAQGSSIKKAQHAAAQLALNNTKYSLPPKREVKQPNLKLAPTVRLNAIIMKSGYEALYEFIDAPNYNYSNECYRPLKYGDANNYYSFYPRHNHVQNIYSVKLNIANLCFYGSGDTRQNAKHNAAFQALEYLTVNRLEEAPGLKKQKQNDKKKPKASEEPEKKAIEQNESEKASTSESAVSQKCVISLVQEFAIKRNMPLKYELIHESGPSHIKKYVTRCTVGELETIGEGNSKKESKKESTSNMAVKIEEAFGSIQNTLASKNERKRNINKTRGIHTNQKKNAVSQISSSTTGKIAKNESVVTENTNTETENLESQSPETTESRRKKAKNIIKVKKAHPEYGKGSINPISRLIQVQQTKRGPEPKYEFLGETLNYRRREFTIQVSVGDHRCIGLANNKRTAKQYAAQNMLSLLGYQRQVAPKPALKSSNSSKLSSSNPNALPTNEKKVKFVDEKPYSMSCKEDSPKSAIADKDDKSKEARNHVKLEPTQAEFVPKTVQLRAKISNRFQPHSNKRVKEAHEQYHRRLYYAYVIAAELVNTGRSPTAEYVTSERAKYLARVNPGLAEMQNTVVSLKTDSSYRDRLDYLAGAIEFQINFHSLNKRDEVTSYVAFNPQLEQTFSGSGKNATESCNEASLHALKYLAERGKTIVNIQSSVQSNNQTLELTVQNLAKSNREGDAVKAQNISQISPSVSHTNSIASTSSSSSNSSTSTIILNQKFVESSKFSHKDSNDEAKN